MKQNSLKSKGDILVQPQQHGKRGMSLEEESTIINQYYRLRDAAVI